MLYTSSQMTVCTLSLAARYLPHTCFVSHASHAISFAFLVIPNGSRLQAAPKFLAFSLEIGETRRVVPSRITQKRVFVAAEIGVGRHPQSMIVTSEGGMTNSAANNYKEHSHMRCLRKLWMLLPKESDEGYSSDSPTGSWNQQSLSSEVFPDRDRNAA